MDAQSNNLESSISFSLSRLDVFRMFRCSGRDNRMEDRLSAAKCFFFV